MMGRTRKSRKDLPQRVYHRHGAYYFVDRGGKWHRLGTEYQESLIEYARLNSAPEIVLTLGQVMDRYQAEVMPTKATRTQEDNLAELANLRAAFGHMRPDDVTPQEIYQYMDLRGAPVRANRERSLLSDIYSYAIRLGAATRNPVKLTKPNKEKPRDRYVEDREFWAVYDLASPVLKVAMMLAWQTGLRQGKILELKREHLTDSGIQVDAGKGGKKLLIVWTDELREVVKEAKGLREVSSLWLVCNRQGQKYTRSGFKAMWGRLMTMAVASGAIAERFTFHDLRAKSGSDHATGDHLGHQNTATLERVYRRKRVEVSPVRPKK